MKTGLTIAGSDSSGGAGIQADLKTFSALGVYGMSVITAITAQNTVGVQAVEEVSGNMVGQQIDAIFQDIPADAVKIGMVSSANIIQVIADKVKQYNMKHVVLDTVMISKSGCHLLKPEAIEALKKYLIPSAYIVTPNIFEAEVLTEMKIRTIEDMQSAARKIYEMGVPYVVVKGGHLEQQDCVDILYDGSDFRYYSTNRIDTKNTHGTGCTFSAAIASHLALGKSVEDSIDAAKQYITKAIEKSLSLGNGVGPTHHFHEFY
ncbi:bifunctional hydroxymethylpyrimidine kinase/phosphomethylpyrimidine kinase [Desulfuribacillus stibiiarsenatis]|uniref:Hydroxymethylpyrimidine/phosphomethylpyrimidine kinase n=1 Tax=Desulfuribacillus stibiiarsenatis TaxID=1390249 RepID=A0A1E5L860_9FIRM|nr:bifunctional hydroxymethylpyrimidine kinase/phosphomethylpyrimidine kinase [Desulfuribacillus stibiiarsenatis]OEH86204.1 bifunctional hydroxymethylpyrimidine kinase/phosphomethylpyrimidine kinase [Desulfuribacillus stibiiarsenatis]